MTEIIEDGNAPTIYADGFEDHQIVNGVMRCTGFVFESAGLPGMAPIKRAIIKLVISGIGASAAVLDAERALGRACTTKDLIWRGTERSH